MLASLALGANKIGRITQEHWLDFMTPSTLLRLALDQFQLGNSTPLQSGKGMSVMNLNRLDFHTRLDHTIGNHYLFSELPAPGQMIPARLSHMDGCMLHLSALCILTSPSPSMQKITLKCKLIYHLCRLKH